MSDNHEEAARKKDLAAKYFAEMQKLNERFKEIFSADQYDFFKNTGRAGVTTTYSDLVSEMKQPGVVPSKYVSKKLSCSLTWLS